MDFTSLSFTIRTHGAIVGILLATETIFPLVLWSMKKEDLPTDITKIPHIQETLLGLGIANIPILTIFLIGFLKKLRWCLIVFYGCRVIVVVLMFLVLFMNLPNTYWSCWCMILLTITPYVLTVTEQRREGSSLKDELNASFGCICSLLREFMACCTGSNQTEK